MFQKQASYQRTQVVENTFLKNKVLHPQAFMFQYLWIPEYNMQICNVLLFMVYVREYSLSVGIHCKMLPFKVTNWTPTKVV